MSDAEQSIEIEAMWEYGDPEASETRFRAALASAQGDARLELLTQIARTYGLRGRFDEAHAQLDEVASQVATAGAGPRVRLLLERGRTRNSSGQKDKAVPLFGEAWELARTAGLTGLAVDAAHMLAIVHSGTPEAIEWNERGLEIARPSDDPKAQALIPAMLNNGAWDLHGMGRFEQALEWFREAEREWIARGKPMQIQIAGWSVARCLRSLSRYDEALTIQRELEAEHEKAGTGDGYVFEELAENLAALGKDREAKPYFARAYSFLKKELGKSPEEQPRLERLRQRGGS